jgi:hypothetical protein
VLVVTLVLVVIAAVDVIRRPPATWTSERERTVWLALLVIPVVVTLVSFSVVGPLIALVELVAYLVVRRGRSSVRTT